MKILAIVLIILVAQLGRADLSSGPEALTNLENKADLILVASIQSITNDSQGDVLLLDTQTILQGSPGSLQIIARFLPPPGMAEPPKTGLLPKGWIGSTGVWFLQAGASGYQVLPLATGFYNDRDAFLPVAPADAQASTAGSIEEKLLWYLGQWYVSLSSPTAGDDTRLLRTLDLANLADSLVVSNSLISSSNPDQVTIGIAAAIRRNSDAAIMALANNITSLQASHKFNRVLEALSVFYRPAGTGALPALQSLVSQKLAIAGLDAALSSALARIGAKAVLPAMAVLLDSQDQQAQLRAASFFANFATFADATGNIPGTMVPGPFFNQTTQANTPKKGSAATPGEYAQFWKTWWSANQTTLGFAPQ